MNEKNVLIDFNCSALAPFINQLRDLHNLSDEIEKKIRKHLSLLKIKSTEETNFLEQISPILHQTDQYHLILNRLKQLEFKIDKFNYSFKLE